ncbi:hypothetical protein B0J13DRAFT_53003 [Dactylonectria estremocensis]|uniref:Uncharacterized protein n=1 Tax=Dactylonectria estremocensis TaxID=1079267 RepID=A0A9P9EQ60_9HYPO|nr:hypothetical protein B0J13DRAFT_53003 [Dactylonectria estremocensis]
MGRVARYGCHNRVCVHFLLCIIFHIRFFHLSLLIWMAGMLSNGQTHWWRRSKGLSAVGSDGHCFDISCMGERASPHSAIIESRRCSYSLFLLRALAFCNPCFIFACLLLLLLFASFCTSTCCRLSIHPSTRQGLSNTSNFASSVYNLSDKAYGKRRDGRKSTIYCRSWRCEQRCSMLL